MVCWVNVSLRVLVRFTHVVPDKGPLNACCCVVLINHLALYLYLNIHFYCNLYIVLCLPLFYHISRFQLYLFHSFSLIMARASSVCVFR